MSWADAALLSITLAGMFVLVLIVLVLKHETQAKK